MNKFFVIRMDDNGDYVDEWEGVADSFATLDEAKDFIRRNAGAYPGVKYIAAQAITVGEAEIPRVNFTEMAP